MKHESALVRNDKNQRKNHENYEQGKWWYTHAVKDKSISNCKHQYIYGMSYKQHKVVI